MSEPRRQLAAIMFTDIVGYTAIMGKDEQKALALLKKNKEIHERLIAQYNGKLLKEIGDGILASFSSVSEAVYCAGAIQKGAKEEEISLRIGIHEGEVVFQDNDIFGDGVNIASRIEALATTGEILLSESAYKNIKNKEGIQTEFVNEETLKNVDEPVRIYRVSVDISVTDGTSGYTYSATAASSAETKPKSKRKMIFGALIAGLIAIAGWWYFQLSPPLEEDFYVGDSRIAILPFENKTNDPDLDMLGEMAADYIIKGLMSLENIKVVSYESVKDQIEFASASMNDNSGLSFAERTGAEKFIRGNFYEQGDQLVFQGQLVNAVSGEIEHVLSEVSGSRTNLNGIVVELQQRIMTLFVKEDWETSTTSKLPTYESYKKYQEGLAEFGVDFTDYTECRKLLYESIAMDSSYVWPYVWIMISYSNQGMYVEHDSLLSVIENRFKNLSYIESLYVDWERQRTQGTMMTAYAVVKKMYEKDPKMFFNNYLMGVYSGRLNKTQESVRSFQVMDVASINYDYPWKAWWNRNFAGSLIRLKRFDEAYDILSYVPSDMTSTAHYDVLLTAYILNGDDNLPEPMLKKMENENFSWEQITGRYIRISRAYLLTANNVKHKEWATRTLDRIAGAGDEPELIIKANAYYLAGDYRKAIGYYETASQSEPLNSVQQRWLGCAFARLGKKEEAKKLITELKIGIVRGTNGNHLYSMAAIYTALGQKETATDLLIQAFNAGRNFTIYSYDLDPDLLPLHGYPAYEEFVKPKG